MIHKFFISVRFSLKFSHQTRNIQFVHLVLCCQVAWHLTKTQKFLIGSVNFCFLWHNFQRFTQIHHTADLLCKFCENSYGLSAGVYSKSRRQPLLLPHLTVRAESKGMIKQVLTLPWLVFVVQGRKDGQPNPGEDEELHALVTGPNEQSVQKAVAMVSHLSLHCIFVFSVRGNWWLDCW